MTSRKPRKLGVPPCPARALILSRVKALQTNLANVSAKLGKNPTYIQQFIWRESPRALPKDVRYALADILKVSPQDLDVDAEEERVSRPARSTTLVPSAPQGSYAAETSIAPAATGLRTWGSAGNIPQYSDVDDIEPPNGGTWENVPTALSLGGVAFALWITQPRGRLRVEMVLVRAGQPPRVGDMVVVLRNKQVAAIGELCDLTRDEAHVSRSDMHSDVPAESYRRRDVQLLKVAAAEFA